jgi:4-amino-4-deoxy-L-arabinose transferase-like glycosyltransferase
MQGIVEIIERRPGAALAAFLALHMVAWSALPATLYPNLPLDLIEALTYGREWQLGYDKLPPLPWWLVEATRVLFGPDLFYYALAQITVCAAFIAVWAMARPLVGGAGALAAILIIDGLHYFNFTAAKFNHDVVQLPFWALAGYAYWAALRQGRTIHWVLLGLAIGISLWAKYFVVMLAVPLALFMLIDRDARPALATPGPWIAVVVAAIVAAPHIVWLVRNDFVPLAYADARAVPARDLLERGLNPIKFLVFQLGTLLPSLLIAAPYLRRDVSSGWTPVQADAFDRRIVALLAFGPAAMVAVTSLVSGRATVTMWGYPLWLFLGLWIVMNARTLEKVTLSRIALLWGVVFLLSVGAFIAHHTVQARWDQRYRAELFPGRPLALEMSRRFRALTGQPLAYVIAGMWDGGNVAHYAPERPRVLIDGSPRRAPWIDLGDLRARGAIVLWTDGSDPRVLPRRLRAVAEDAEVQTPLQLRPHVAGPVVTVGWAVLRPRPVVAVRPAP